MPRISKESPWQIRCARLTSADKLIDIVAVEIIGEHELRLTFEDGLIGEVSFDDSEWQGVFEPLRDPQRFARVSIAYGTIAWPDDGLDMAPEPLFEEAGVAPRGCKRKKVCSTGRRSSGRQRTPARAVPAPAKGSRVGASAVRRTGASGPKVAPAFDKRQQPFASQKHLAKPIREIPEHDHTDHDHNHECAEMEV
jgi:hypothetical protein